MFEGLQGTGGDQQSVQLTLYTDAYVIRGSMRTRQRRITDILNGAEHDFIVLSEVVMDEYGSREIAVRAEFAQVNLSAVLFAVGDSSVEAVPEPQTPTDAERAMVSIPPFRIAGRIHLPDIREAVGELVGRF